MVVLAITGGDRPLPRLPGHPDAAPLRVSFFTQTQWQPELDRIGIAAVLVGTVEVALVAMVVSFPLALASRCSSRTMHRSGSSRWLVSAVDLMAAVPSIIYGLWGFFLLQPHAISWPDG